MTSTIRKTIVYNDILKTDDGKDIASLRATVNMSRAGAYTVSCTPVNEELYRENKDDVDAAQAEFSAMVQAEVDSEVNSAEITSETAPAEEETETKSTGKKASK